MWSVKSLVQMTTVSLLFSGLVLLVYQVYQWEQEEHAVRCNAAQVVVLEEADLIAAAGEFPGEKITNRWKQLLGGCD